MSLEITKSPSKHTTRPSFSFYLEPTWSKKPLFFTTLLLTVLIYVLEAIEQRDQKGGRG